MNAKGATAGTRFNADASRALVRAGWLGRTTPDGPDYVSFHSLFAGLAFGNDETAAWMRRTAETRLDWDAFLACWAQKPSAPRHERTRLDEARRLTPAQYDRSVPSLSGSSTRIEDNANEIARTVGATEIGTQHLAAAFLIGGHAHDDDLKAWKLDREAWWRRFLIEVAQRSRDALPRWSRAGAVYRRLSAGLGAVGRSAQIVAASASPVPVDSTALFTGLLLDGRASGEPDYTAAWFHRTYGAALDAALGLSKYPNARVLDRKDEPTWADDAEAVLARAQVFASAGDRDTVHIRHLLAAFLTWPGELPLDKTVAATFRRDAALPAFLEHVREQYTDYSGEPDGWDEILRAGEVRFAGYTADTPEGPDLLGIRRDVEGIAAVVASKDVSPPLSIGLFGDWGSGKSFFMELLQKRVDDLARVAREASKAKLETAYRGRIAQIEFNAWHYADANLWASMSVHIWSSLEEELRRDGKAEKLVETVKSLESAQMQQTLLEGAHARAKERELTAAVELEAARAREVSTWAVLSKAVLQRAQGDAKLKEAIAHAEKKTGLEDLAAIRSRYDELKQDTGRVRSWLDANRGTTVVAGLLLVAAMIVLPIVLDGAAQYLAPLGTMIAGIGGALEWVRRHTNAPIKAVDALIKEVERAEEEARDDSTAEERKALDAATAERQRLEVEKAKLPAEIKRLEAEIANLRGRVDMRSLILERASQDDYRKYLGLVSTIHRHFADLARALSEKDTPVERIVLYIDDLDRCRPDRVVEVLQAVHLLLSLPLFVVVVAVDSRWLLQSLEDYYARRFRSRPGINLDAVWGPDMAAAPMHYLEKIFQVPFGLRAPRDGFGGMVSALVAPHVAARPASSGTTASEGTAGPSADPKTGEQPAERAPTPPSAPPPPPPRRAPRNLRLEPGEADDLAKAAALIGTPRGAKRLVNLYRIVRASIDDAELDAFVARRARPLQVCLALVVGKSALARALFRDMFSGEITSIAGVLDFCRSEASEDPRWLEVVDQFVDRLADADWDELYEAARLTARFSFEIAVGQTVREPVVAAANAVAVDALAQAQA